MTPQERQVWRMTYATAYAHSLDVLGAIVKADRAVKMLRSVLDRGTEANRMARDAMNLQR